jgi:hypothetical protein
MGFRSPFHVLFFADGIVRRWRGIGELASPRLWPKSSVCL